MTLDEGQSSAANRNPPVTGGSGRLFGWIFFIGLAITLFLLVRRKQTDFVTISLDEFEQMLHSDEIARATISEDSVFGTLREKTLTGARGEASSSYRASAPKGASGNWLFIEWVLANRKTAAVDIDASPNLLLQVILPLIPWLLIFGFIWFFVFRQMRRGAVFKPQPIPVYQVAAPEPLGNG